MRQRPQEQDRFERRNNFDAVEENLTPEQWEELKHKVLSCNPEGEYIRTKKEEQSRVAEDSPYHTRPPGKEGR